MPESSPGQLDALGRHLGVTPDGLRRAAGHGLQLLATNGAVGLLGFLTPLAFVRLSSPADYGRFSLIASVLALANIVTLPGIAMSLRQSAARGHHGVLAASARTRLKWGLLGIVALALTAWWMYSRNDPRTGMLLLIVAPILPLIYGLDLAPHFLSGVQWFGALSAWTVAGALVPSAVVVLALVFHAGPARATLGYFAAVAAMNVVSFAWVMRHRANRSVDPESIPYGKRLTVISALGALQSYADKVVVGAFLSVEALAMYSAGKMFQQVLTMTWSAMNQMYFPKLASREVAEARRLARSTLVLVWLGFAALGAAVIVVTPWVIRTVFGARYVPSIPLAQIFTLGVVFAIPGAQFEVLFTATSDERRLYVQRVTFAVLQLVLVALGAYVDGARGAAIGVALTYAGNSLNGWLLDRRR